MKFEKIQKNRKIAKNREKSENLIFCLKMTYLGQNLKNSKNTKITQNEI